MLLRGIGCTAFVSSGRLFIDAYNGTTLLPTYTDVAAAMLWHPCRRAGMMLLLLLLLLFRVFSAASDSDGAAARGCTAALLSAAHSGSAAQRHSTSAVLNSLISCAASRTVTNIAANCVCGSDPRPACEPPSCRPPYHPAAACPPRTPVAATHRGTHPRPIYCLVYRVFRWRTARGTRAATSYGSLLYWLSWPPLLALSPLPLLAPPGRFSSAAGYPTPAPRHQRTLGGRRRRRRQQCDTTVCLRPPRARVTRPPPAAAQ